MADLPIQITLGVHADALLKRGYLEIAVQLRGEGQSSARIYLSDLADLLRPYLEKKD